MHNKWGFLFCFLFFLQAPKEDIDLEGAIGIGTRSKKENIEQKLLIGGCADGTIVVFNWKEDEKAGKIVFSLQVF